MFRHNDLEVSLSQVLHFILQFVLTARKPPPQRLPGSVPPTGMLALLPGCIMCGGQDYPTLLTIPRGPWAPG